MIEAGIMGAAVALLNGVREAGKRNFLPLFYTVSSGLIALFIGWLLRWGGVQVETPIVQAIIDSPVLAFVLGLGGSGFYTIGTKLGSSNGESAPIVG